MKWNILFICLLINLIHEFVLADVQALTSSLTLGQLLSETSNKSLAIQKAEAVKEEAHWKKIEAYSGFLPTVSASVNYLTDKKYMLLDTSIGGAAMTIPQVVPTTLYSLKFNLPLFDGFSSTNRLRASRSLQDAADNDYQWTQFSITRQAVLQFYKSLAAEVLKDVSVQNLKTLQDHLKDIQAFKKAGVSTNYDLLRAEVQVSEAQSELLNAEDNLQMSKLKLGELTGQDIETRNPQGELPLLSENIINQLEKNKDHQSRQDIVALQQRQQALDEMYSSMNRYWIPKISLFGEALYYNNKTDGFNDSDSFRNAYTMGLNLTWNIFDGMASTARSGLSEQQAIQGSKSVKMAEIKSRQDEELWKRKFKYFTSVCKSRINDIARSEESVRLAKLGRKAGITTSTQLLDAISDLYRSRAGKVNAQIGAIEALINLELASGQQLYDFKN